MTKSGTHSGEFHETGAIFQREHLPSMCETLASIISNGGPQGMHEFHVLTKM